MGSEWLLSRASAPELLLYWIPLVAGSELLLSRAAVLELLLYWLLLAAGLHRTGPVPPLLRSSASSQLEWLQPVDLLSFLLEKRCRFIVDVPPT